MIYEIRDYHYRPDIFDEYKAWAEEAVPVLKANMDIVGFWIDRGIAPEIRGSQPMDSPLGSANVTWIIRWDSKEQRDQDMPKALSTQAWKDVWAKHPDANGYLQMSGRFMEEM